VKLLKEEELIWSSVVANCNMNRKRKLIGVNSYEKDIRFDILKFLTERATTQKEVKWIDLCCGEGNAVIEASKIIQEQQINNLAITGIDLVDLFENHQNLPFINFEVQSLLEWTTNQKYDLITCVHGLHYVGNKLIVIQKSLQALKKDGIFIANLALDNVKDANGKSLKRYLLKRFRQHELSYDAKNKILIGKGPRKLELELSYLGANDRIGKNYTGQEVVDSHYKRI